MRHVGEPHEYYLYPMACVEKRRGGGEEKGKRRRREGKSPAFLLLGVLPVCAPSWVRLTETGGGDGVPVPRYGHAAAIVAPHAGAMSLAVTWGYSSTPSEARWLDDAWFASPGVEGVRWRRGVSPPFARFGHVLLSLDGALLLHGGDDGGRGAPLLGGGYSPGSYTAESWLLQGQGGKWDKAATPSNSDPPPALAGHACAQLNGDSVLCFGGSTAAPTRSRPVGYAVPDSDDTWLVVLAGDAVTWTRVATAARPAARHGHSMIFLPRPAVVPAISALEAPSIMLENAVYLTGGASVNSSTCGGRLLVGACTHSDLWRFVWYSEPGGAGGRGATSGVWQRVAFSGREDLRPSARSYAGMAGVGSVHSGLGLAPLLTPSALLHGGAECDPSCTCFADTWLLVPAPIATVAVGRLSAALVTHVQAGVAWRRVAEGAEAPARPPVGLRPPPAPYSLSDEAVSLLGAELTVLHAAQSSSSGSWLLPAAPAAVPNGRYRHSLNSLEATSRMLAWAEEAATQVGSALAALLRTDSGGLAPEDLRSFLTEALADPPSGLATPPLPPLPTVALLFGGESYQPSTYYSDLWAWSDADVVRRTFDGRVRRARPKAPLSDSAVAVQYAVAAAAYFLGLGGLLRLASAWRARVPWANHVVEEERLAAALRHDEEGHVARRDSPVVEGSVPGNGVDVLDVAVLSSLRWLRRVQGRAEAKRRHA